MNYFNLLSKIKLERITRWYDLPHIYQYSAFFIKIPKIIREKSLGKLNKNKISGVGTSFLSKRKAKLRAIYELLERFALAYIDKQDVFKQKVSQLRDEDKSFLKKFLDEKDIFYLTKINPRFNNFIPQNNDSLYFTYAIDIINRKKILIPAQLIYVPDKFIDKKILREPNSTGAAAGENLYYCLVKGILEIFERDAFMIYYLNGFFGERIDINKYFKYQNLLKKIQRYKLELYVFHLPSDFHVFNIVALILDRSGQLPIVNCGSCSGFDAQYCILKSIEEALQVAQWIRYIKSFNNHLNFKYDLNKLEERGLFWCDLSKRQYIEKLIKSSTSKNNHFIYLEKYFNKLGIKSFNYRKLFRFLVKEIRDKNFDLLYKEITPEFFKKNKVRIIKTIIPQVQHIYLGEDFKYINIERLNILKKFKFIDNRRKTTINYIPHFFL